MPVAVQFPQILAHRGASAYAAENTIKALRLAKTLGASWVEFDVMLSADGQAVIMHDWTVNRTTTGKGRVSTLTLAELLRLDAGVKFSPADRGELIPTLAQWLAVCAELKLGINIEIKERAVNARKIAVAVYEALATFWSDDLPQPLISSATPACLDAYHVMDPTAIKGLIFGYWPFWWRFAMRRHHCEFLVLSAKRVTRSRVEALKAAGYALLVYTVNTRAESDALFDLGVDGVFTDDLKHVKRFTKETA